MSEAAYKQVKTYCDDLSERIRLLDEWQKRHPDWDSGQFIRDGKHFSKYKEQGRIYTSSFDPNDLSPRTDDVLTAQTFNNIMLIALAAYEKAIHNG